MFEKMQKFLDKKLNGIFLGTTPNQYAARPMYLEVSADNETIFNEVYLTVKNSDMYALERTESGSIKKGPRYTNNLYAWDVRKSSIGLMLTINCGGKLYVIKYGNFKGKKAPEIFPNAAFDVFSEKCLEHGINLNDYMISNGAEIKEEIESPMISMYELHTENDKGLENVHHIDFHNSYPAGLANTHPEFRPVVEYFYNNRKVDPVNKAVLNYSIGWMQSYKPDKGRRAEWAHLSRDAIKDNNDRMEELTVRLLLGGRKIIGHNTDGIWYQGEIYHGEGEGKGLGQWENDHTNCIFRAKSDGAYEFIENGVYNAVVRGQTSYDAIEPDRTKWTWGDIYKATNKVFYFDEERGIYSENL